MTQLIQFEAEATALRVFHTTLIPGVMQTPAYAETVLGYWSEDMPEDQRITRAEMRARRRDQMLNRHDPPSWYVVLDESVLLRELGGKKAMAEQLQHLLELAQEPHVSIRVLPLAQAAAPAILGVFSILDLREEENAVLYKESGMFDEIIHTRDRVERHRQRFEQMWDSALNEDASARLIEASATAMRPSLDRLS